MNKLEINGRTFGDIGIVKGSILRTKSAIGDELAFDTFDIVIDGSNGLETLEDVNDVELHDTNDVVLLARTQGFNPDDYNRGDSATFTHDGVLVGKFYLDYVTRVSKTNYKLHFISALGLLDDIVHAGGVYNSVQAGNIIRMMFDATYISQTGEYLYYEGIVPYYISEDVLDTHVNGWLPYSTSARDNLKQLLFAIGASATKNDAGELVFSYWQPTNAIDIDSTRLYEGGEVQLSKKPTKIVVNEHTFASTVYDTEVQLYETTVSVSNVKVLFNNPCHDLKWNGVDFTGDYNENYAVVSGIGVLTGKEFTHTINTLEKDTGVGGKEYIKTVENAYLVSKANSANVIERVASYYVDAELIDYGMEVTGDAKSGDRVHFIDPFGEETTAYMLDENITISGILKSQTVFIKNWQPNHTGNIFSNYRLLTTQGAVFHPNASEIGKVAKLVIFGGFKGGQGGGGSTSGTGGAYQPVPAHSSASLPNGQNGLAGSAGLGGEGVMKYETEITLADQDYVLTQLGAGGLGGEGGNLGQDGASGQIGGTTICAGYSSANGSLLTTGFANPLTGDVYGEKGIDGCKGGEINETITYLGNTYTAGVKGEDYSWNISGVDEQDRPITVNATCRGSYGSGAFYGYNGTDGNRISGVYAHYGADGVSSVTPVNAPTTRFGKCGNGGHGANAPSGGGGVSCYNGYYDTAGARQGYAGLGAKGSNGSNGSNGFALFLIYRENPTS